MKDKVEDLRRKYKSFGKGEEDPLTVRREAMLVFEEAKKSGRHEIMVEVEDMLVDLEFSIEENKCKCHQKHSSC